MVWLLQTMPELMFASVYLKPATCAWDGGRRHRNVVIGGSSSSPASGRRGGAHLARLPTHHAKEVGPLLVGAAVIRRVARGALGLEDLGAAVSGAAVRRSTTTAALLAHCFCPRS